MKRRNAFRLIGAAALAPWTLGAQPAARKAFQLRYVLSSALYGDMKLEDVLPEVVKSGAIGIDIWRQQHATHREQIAEMGDDAFQALLKKNGTQLSISTCYPLGPFGRDEEMAWVKKNGGNMTVCATKSMGEKDPSGAEAKRQVKAFFEKLEPHLAVARENGVMMAFENHANAMLHHPDSLRYFAEFNPDPGHIGIAFAPHHLQSFGDEAVAPLIRELGNKQIPFIYFQEHGIGSKETVEKEIELEQLPGRGTLDYVPIVKALKDIGFTGVAEIFMHPTPRGIPILPAAEAITREVNRSRAYIEKCLAEVNA